MEVWVATGNQGKLKEYQAMFASVAVELHSQNELPVYSSPDETGETFEANARIKAKSMAAMKAGTWVFAEDSGLMVEGLGGLPGVHSARYAGAHASDPENRAKLLKMMKIRSATKREAKFVACVVAISPEGQEHVFMGEMSGTIATQEAGKGGFGYDPVFIPEGESRTLAEMEPGEKNAISHRKQAAKQLIELLKSQL
jgi:XTP/dITP diphosphohydrolase